MIPTLSGDARTVGDFGEDLVDMSCHLFSRWRTGVAEKGFQDGAWEELEDFDAVVLEARVRLLAPVEVLTHSAHVRSGEWGPYYVTG